MIAKARDVQIVAASAPAAAVVRAIASAERRADDAGDRLDRLERAARPPSNAVALGAELWSTPSWRARRAA